jgi:CYTH domain-containing protein
MPIENERKFVLNEQATELEAELGRKPGVARHLLRQAYLDASGLRIRSLEGGGKTDHVFTYKRTIEGQVVEIETGISAIDFARLWTQRVEALVKVRYSWTEGRYHWDVDFFKRDDGSTYFAMAEVEMPETQTEPPPLPDFLAAHLLMIAPAQDPRFTSKRVADQAHALQLLADIRSNGGIAQSPDRRAPA